MELQEVIARLLKTLQDELDRIVRAQKDSKDYATDEESRAESQWDTHGLEASYLAAGQAKMAQEVADMIRAVQAMRHAEPAPAGRAVAGSLVEVRLDGRREWFLLSAAGGGESLRIDGNEVTVVTPQSPIGTCLLGKRAADAFRLPNGVGGSVLSVQ